MKNKKAVVLFLFLVATTFVFTSCKDSVNEKVAPPTVIVSKVKTAEIKETMTLIGQVKALDKVYLRARVKGFLINRNFKEGAYVQKGDLLFQIEKDKYEADLETAKAQLITAQAELKNKMIDFNRQKYLIKRDVVSEKSYDLAEAEKQIADANIMSAKAVVSEAQLDLSYTDIYAPFAGRIGLASYSVGNVVGPTSDSLALITKIDPIGVEFNLNEALIVRILQYIEKTEKIHPLRSGEKTGVKYLDVKLLMSNGVEYSRIGRIDFLDNQINPMTGTILARARFDNPNSILISGAYVKVQISTKFKTKRMLIPQAAIQEDQTGTFVLFINSKNEVVKKNVKTSGVYGIDIVISEGLKVGDRVIVEGLQKVRDGMVVKPVIEKTKTPPDNDKSKDQEQNKKEQSAAADSVSNNAAKDSKKTNNKIQKLKDHLINTNEPEKNRTTAENNIDTQETLQDKEEPKEDDVNDTQMPNKPSKELNSNTVTENKTNADAGTAEQQQPNQESNQKNNVTADNTVADEQIDAGSSVNEPVKMPQSNPEKIAGNRAADNTADLNANNGNIQNKISSNSDNQVSGVSSTVADTNTQTTSR